MTQPNLPRCRRKPPAPAIRTMDLLGIGKDGQLYLWDAAQQVQPVSTFERRGTGIVSGHYVIEHLGTAITVHCGNLTDGRVSIQYMCGGLECLYLARKHVEPMLLGKVIPDPVQQAGILRMLGELSRGLDAKNSAPHLRRGKL